MNFTGLIKKSWIVLFVFTATLLMGSCSVGKGPLEDGSVPEGGTQNGVNDSTVVETPASIFEFTTKSDGNNPFFVVPGNDFVLEYSGEKYSGVEAAELQNGWSVDVDESACKVTVKADAEAVRDVKIVFKARNNGGKEVDNKYGFYLLNSFDDPKGAFVLNEGNMTTENGSLTYITPEGYVVDDAYKTVNGTELGNVAQDMAFCNGKIYVISQNGNENAVGTKFDNDGMLVVMNAKTLKKEKAFSNEELSGLYWPSHIAVLDESHVYIRDNKDNKGSIWRLDTNTGSLVHLDGSEGAPRTPFVVKGGKVYTYNNSGYLSKLISIDTSSDKISTVNLPSYTNKVYQIKDAEDNSIWVLAKVTDRESPNWVIKVDLSNPSARNAPYRKLPILPSPDWNTSGNYFTSYNNTVYYNDGTSIYSFPFDIEESEPVELVNLSELDENAQKLYNGMSVNLSDGHFYINTIRGVGPFYTTNSVWVFDINGSWSSPINKYDNYTNFPAGIFSINN